MSAPQIGDPVRVRPSGAVHRTEHVRTSHQGNVWVLFACNTELPLRILLSEFPASTRRCDKCYPDGAA